MQTLSKQFWILVAVSVGVLLVLPVQAALLTFDDAVSGATSYSFDGDGDLIDDVIFSTTDPLGFNTIGPGPFQAYIDEPGLEGTTLLNPDLRVDFLVGAVNSITVGFALDSTSVSPVNTASLALFDASDNLLGSATVVGDKFDLGGGVFSTFVEGQISIVFSGQAAYGLFDFATSPGRYIIDNFEGTFGSSEPVPEPTTMVVLGCVSVGMLGARRLTRRKE